MDADTLRDRIADMIEDENCCYVCRDGALKAAQAFLDDLGLTVETATLYGVRENGEPFTGTRVVGKWEAEEA